MLVSYLERGMQLRMLSASQMLEVEKAFTWYLLKTIRYQQAVPICVKVLDPDQEHLKIAIKQRLTALISDHDCNVLFKPALLRLAAKDDSLFRQLNTDPERSLKILRSNRERMKFALNEVKFPIDIIGPDHIRELQDEHLHQVESHAYRYVSKNMKFLTMGDSGISIEDMVTDLKALALSAMRQYYPFREGLHLTNTMRSTITNRGRSAITYSTSQRRQRVSMTGLSPETLLEENNRKNLLEKCLQSQDFEEWRRFKLNQKYKMENREAGGVALDVALNTHTGTSIDGGLPLELDIQAMAEGENTAALIARFVLDQTEQDAFCSWIERHVKKVVGAADVASAVRMSGISYSWLLAKYFGVPREEVAETLNSLKRMAG
jgi:hypothetical protein